MDRYDQEVERLTELYREWEKNRAGGSSPIIKSWFVPDPLYNWAD